MGAAFRSTGVLLAVSLAGVWLALRTGGQARTLVLPEAPTSRDVEGRRSSLLGVHGPVADGREAERNAVIRISDAEAAARDRFVRQSMQAYLDWMDAQLRICENPGDTMLVDLRSQVGSEDLSSWDWDTLETLSELAPSVRLSVAEAKWIVEMYSSSEEDEYGNFTLCRLLDEVRPGWRGENPDWPTFVDSFGLWCVAVPSEVNIDDEPVLLSEVLCAKEGSPADLAVPLDEEYFARRRKLLTCYYGSDTLVGDLMRSPDRDRIDAIPGAWSTLDVIEKKVCPGERLTVEEAVFFVKAWDGWGYDDYRAWLDIHHPGWRER